MKNVGSRRVVDDDDFVKLAAESAQVFDVVAAVEDAGLAEQPRVKHVPLVQEVRHWIGVLEKIRWNFNYDFDVSTLLMFLTISAYVVNKGKFFLVMVHRRRKVVGAVGLELRRLQPRRTPVLSTPAWNQEHEA